MLVHGCGGGIPLPQPCWLELCFWNFAHPIAGHEANRGADVQVKEGFSLTSKVMVFSQRAPNSSLSRPQIGRVAKSQYARVVTA